MNPEKRSPTSNMVSLFVLRLALALVSLVQAQWDGSCSSAAPCPNGACCGKSGYCGYSPDFCGDGCLSNCDAHAECGKYSDPPNKKCPLNVCCSQHGFCGTTSEFCGDKCQSNCVEHPKPPAGGDGGGVFKKVIGYYEGWNARSKCHKNVPEDLPLSALTHVNFAFVFVTPKTYELVPMDSATPEDLFKQTTNLKDLNPSLKVFASLGGWTFSDNDTVTQPLLGEIAADAGKRVKFANNIVSFLDEHGFDGIDIDWEYPGASDRGGKPEDTKNMVQMFKEIRQALDNSGRQLGLTFTIPASFWYLRWFDVPGLLQYADWTNLMSYDIHGVWDRDSQLGSFARPHTNLTEIQLAVELLWRVNVRPSQISLGFGMYGRSFTLSDPSCTRPECPFSEGSRPGVCTNTSGYLAHYEIQDILDGGKALTSPALRLGPGQLDSAAAGPEVQYDKKAAVKYFSFDNDQWVSFDDAVTFKQKRDWADDVGFGGSLIWASDLDDYTFGAHSALLGKKLPSNTDLISDGLQDQLKREVADLESSSLSKDCRRFTDCVDLDNPQASGCGRGYTRVSYDRSNCGKGSGLPICCKTATAPSKCIWRGGGKDCNGQCHPGEATLFSSRWGGKPGESSDGAKCNRGRKYLCCDDPKYGSLTESCYWTTGRSGGKCKGNEIQVAQRKYLDERDLNIFSYEEYYCCKTKTAPLSDCHWVGKGDCADNTCDDNDITLDTSPNGDSEGTCNWWRSKALCCTPELDALSTTTCQKRLCDIKGLKISCDVDPYADDFSDENQCDPEDCFEGKQAISPPRHLDKRGQRREFHIDLEALGIAFELFVLARRYPGSTHLHDPVRGTPASNNAFRPATGSCSTTSVDVVSQNTLTRQEIENGFDTEHNPDLVYVRDFIATLAEGVLPDGTRTTNGAIDPDDLESYWNLQIAPNLQFPRSGNSRGIRRPNDYFMDQFGSQGNREPMLLCERNMNQMKGRIFSGDAQPQDQDIFESNLRNSIARGSGEDLLLEPIRSVIQVYRYINHPQARPTIQSNRRALLEATRTIARLVPQLSNLHLIHQEFDFNWYQTRTNAARAWVVRRIVEIRTEYNLASQTPAQRTPANAQAVLAAVQSLLRDLSQYVNPPPKDPNVP